MSIFTNLTTNRTRTMAAFQSKRRRAKLSFYLSRLSPHTGQLDSFETVLPARLPSRSYIGIREIPLADITGSVGRRNDFDRSFMPRKNHLCERWVNIYLLTQTGKQPPIRVYKAGGQYFVEDGHHRVSAARALGMVSIQAEVWEYQLKPVCVSDACLSCLPA